MTVHHNDTENFIDYPKYFHQHRSWILIEQEGNTLHPTTTQVSISQLDLLSNSHVFTDIAMFNYIRFI